MNKGILILMLMLASGAFGNMAWALCYDDSKSAKENFLSCQSEAEQGDADAQFLLGLMYADGKGVLQDDKQAVNWYRKAAEQGDARAQFLLGLMYADGIGVLQDDKQAVNWVRKAAEQGFAAAQFNLGVMYANGKGVLQDYTMAHMWLNLAGANGSEDGRKNRDIIAKKMTQSQIEKAQRLASDWMAAHP